MSPIKPNKYNIRYDVNKEKKQIQFQKEKVIRILINQWNKKRNEYIYLLSLILVSGY